MLTFCLNCGKERIETCQFCIRCGTEYTEITPLSVFEKGALLDKRYEIISLIRENDFGIVYHALDLRFKTSCIVKEMLLKYEIQDFKSYLERIRQEVKLFSNTRHPCIPAITNYFVDSGRHFLVTDYFDGKTLDTFLSEKGEPGLPQEMVLSWTVQILDMLDYFHRQDPPIIYRDIDPASIMVKDIDKRIIFLDFYIASADPDVLSRGILPSGHYSAPEEKDGYFSVRSDIFSIGATMYHLLTGKMKNFSDAKLKPITTVLPDLNPHMANIISRALQSDPEKRFSSAQEMKKALLELYQGKEEINMETSIIPEAKEEEKEYVPELMPVSIKPVPLIEESPRYTKKHEVVPAVTKPVHSAITEPLPLPREIKEEDIMSGQKEVDTLDKINYRSGLIKNLITGLIVVIALGAVFLIYKLIVNTRFEGYLTESLICYDNAQSKKQTYITELGESVTAYSFAIDEYTQGIMKLDEYLKGIDNNPEIYYLKANCYFGIYEMEELKALYDEKEFQPAKNEKIEEARKNFNTATIVSPSYFPAYYFLAKCYYIQGDLAKSREALNNCLKYLNEKKDMDIQVKARWEKNIVEAFKSFFEISSREDSSLNGSGIEFVNQIGEMVNIEFNNDFLFINAKDKKYVKIPSGEYDIKVEFNKYSYKDKLNFEENKIYTLNLGNPLTSKFAMFYISDFKKERKYFK